MLLPKSNYWSTGLWINHYVQF